jgi:hypothetical protein
MERFTVLKLPLRLRPLRGQGRVGALLVSRSGESIREVFHPDPAAEADAVFRLGAEERSRLESWVERLQLEVTAFQGRRWKPERDYGRLAGHLSWWAIGVPVMLSLAGFHQPWLLYLLLVAGLHVYRGTRMPPLRLPALADDSIWSRRWLDLGGGVRWLDLSTPGRLIGPEPEVVLLRFKPEQEDSRLGVGLLFRSGREVVRIVVAEPSPYGEPDFRRLARAGAMEQRRIEADCAAEMKLRGAATRIGALEKAHGELG